MDKRKPLPINPALKEYAVKMRKNMTDEKESLVSDFKRLGSKNSSEYR